MIIHSTAIFLSTQKFIFWDFDGVIKDSVEVKSDAFEELFKPFGREISKKVRIHHEANGGMSRFDKLPVYLEWAGQSPTKALIDRYSEMFSGLVTQNVVESEWVPGVLDYIQRNSKAQTFFLITATPQIEIEEILDTLQIQHHFRKVIGAPSKKGDAIKVLLSESSVAPDQAVMIGDSNSDYEAASVNNVPFILRRTSLNQALQEKITCPMIKDFCNE